MDTTIFSLKRTKFVELRAHVFFKPFFIWLAFFKDVLIVLRFDFPLVEFSVIFRILLFELLLERNVISSSISDALILISNAISKTVEIIHHFTRIFTLLSEGAWEFVVILSANSWGQVDCGADRGQNCDREEAA